MKRLSRVIADVPNRFWSKVNKTDKCWIWVGGYDEHGYGIFSIKRIMFKASHIAWLLTYRELPENNLCHTCDNPKCVKPDHLFTCTQQENIDDMYRKGRGLTGEKSGSAKLSWEKVRKIRKRYANHEASQAELGREFGVHFTTIGYIVTNKTWRE